MEYLYKGKKVYYTECGEGEPVLFLHGWGCDGSIFKNFYADLSPQYHVLALDFPGFGQSEEPEEVWGVEEYTKMLEAFCSDLKLASPSLIGHSFGGRVSILFASRNETARVVLVDSAGVKPKRGAAYYIKVYSYKFMKFLLLKVLHSQKLFDAYRGNAGSSDYRNASPKMKAILSKVVNEDLCDKMPLIKAPTLLFWGTNDTATPIEDARKMEKLIPDAGLVEVPGGSHFSFLEAPGMFKSVLKSFFKVK